MSKPTILRITMIFSTALSTLSMLFAMLSGGDVFALATRFALTFVMAAVLIRTTLGVINSMILGAAVDAHLRKAQGRSAPNKGNRIDFTSAAPKDLLNQETPTGTREPVGSSIDN